MALARTVLLGCIAAALGIWWLARAYEVDNEELLGYLLSSIAFVAVTAILGIAGAAALWLVRRRRNRTGRDKPVPYGSSPRRRV